MTQHYSVFHTRAGRSACIFDGPASLDRAAAAAREYVEGRRGDYGRMGIFRGRRVGRLVASFHGHATCGVASCEVCCTKEAV